ncbi:twin-arginine translocase subunit TatC [Fictibacillus aquaticus]|uniref:Sec-independent protein translocase protein TatC n=1 Tax=Fictibacillus aquaticus TaxID=2021314 RepID=A0A235F5A0_9BACL|nr:twin-arginine translocase subunit TatC [Fictibacillus aquaticus]OYD56398.1 twin-arginine translocase subunit TatC [Fictibacillus aquaticus]
MTQDKNMSVYDHIGELRKRLIIISAVFLLFMVAGFFLSRPVIVYLQNDSIAQNIQMNAFDLTDPLKVYISFAFIIGLVMTAPVALYQLWAFISPGLYENERRVTLMYIPISFALFLAGIAFSYLLLFPFVVTFMSNIAETLKVEGEYGIQEYFSFLFSMTLPFGLIFQFPILVMFLTRLGLVTPMLLKNIRKFSYFAILVIAGMITPPELVSHLMVTLPLIVLYEISIFISGFAYRKRLQAEEDALLEEEITS